MDLYAADLLLPKTVDGRPLANIGENSDGLGFGADTPIWSADGFVGIPNAPTDDAAAQGIVLEEGNTKRVIAVHDPRYLEAAGPLALGDRAIVSDSEAWVKLTAAQNRIRLRSSSTGHSPSPVELMIDINGAEGTITLTVGPSFIRITEAVVTITSPTVNVVGVLQVGGVPLQVP